MLDQHLLSFFIRWVHVLSMAFLLGGVLLYLAVIFGTAVNWPSEWLAHLAVRYEWVYWLAIGTQVITGIGNIGSFGAGVPSVDSPWGTKLLVKLIIVALFVLLSLVRTLVVVRIDSVGVAVAPASATPFLKGAYGLSAILLATIVLLAEALGHGW